MWTNSSERASCIGSPSHGRAAFTLSFFCARWLRINFARSHPPNTKCLEHGLQLASPTQQRNSRTRRLSQASRPGALWTIRSRRKSQSFRSVAARAYGSRRGFGIKQIFGPRCLGQGNLQSCVLMRKCKHRLRPLGCSRALLLAVSCCPHASG